MENSAIQAIFTGVYVLIFVAALTVTMFLFHSITDYADKAYEFGTKKAEGSVTISAPTNRYRILNSSEVISYYFNYVKRDLYGTDSIAGTDKTKYSITLEKDNVEMTENFVDEIKKDKKYILIYKGKNENTNEVNITIKEATEDEIQAEF
ncbi:MAG: hypothetical protein RSB67_03980 [Clostridia bacterium]